MRDELKHPIETAARDGSLVYIIDDTGTVAAGKWSGSMWVYYSCDWEQVDFEPTGWVVRPDDILTNKDTNHDR